MANAVLFNAGTILQKKSFNHAKKCKRLHQKYSIFIELLKRVNI